MRPCAAWRLAGQRKYLGGCLRRECRDRADTLQLRLGKSPDANLLFADKLLEHVVAVEHLELFGCIVATFLEQDLLASRVHVGELGHIKHVA